MTQLRIETLRIGEELELRLDGELDVATAEDFACAVLATPPGSTIVLALDQLMFLDSSGLRAILHARNAGRRIELANPRPSILRVLEIAAVLEELPLRPTAA